LGFPRAQLLGEQVDLADAERRRGGDRGKPPGLGKEFPTIFRGKTASHHGGLSFG
jgi:hypothetical protein